VAPVLSTRREKMLELEEKLAEMKRKSSELRGYL
jgi:hypothetical protein